MFKSSYKNIGDKIQIIESYMDKITDFIHRLNLTDKI